MIMIMIMIGTICKIILSAFLLCFIIGLMIPTPTVTIKMRGSVITDIFYPLIKFVAFSVYCGMYAKYLVKCYINKWWFE